MSKRRQNEESEQFTDQNKEDQPRRNRKFNRRSSKEEDKSYEWGQKASQKNKNTEKTEKVDGVNMKPSGNLLKDTNMYRGFVIKYSQPAEARKPHKRWRLYPFKEEQSFPFYQIHRQSAYLFGRNRLVADIPIDHPSCSLQHAALQYRSVEYTRDDQTTGRRIIPYIIDLESTNGTHLNGNSIEPMRFYELKEKDVIRFGFSSREYVMLHENSAEDDLDDVKVIDKTE